MSVKEVPNSVIKRLPKYLRAIDKLISRDMEMASSQLLSKETGNSPEQIRKDLAYFGTFGTKGSGYKIQLLRKKLLKILGLQNPNPNKVVVVGAGNLGKALARYTEKNNPYVELAGIFDKNPQTVGTYVLQHKIKHISELPHLVNHENVKISILAVPPAEAEGAVNFLAENGIIAVLKLTPASITVPEGIYIQDVDINLELQSLMYHVFDNDEELSLENINLAGKL